MFHLFISLISGFDSDGNIIPSGSQGGRGGDYYPSVSQTGEGDRRYPSGTSAERGRGTGGSGSTDGDDQTRGKDDEAPENLEDDDAFSQAG